jgi:hypothetical protein
LFFHPGVYAMSRLMDREREFACDDWVIALTRRPKAYASCLARVVALRRQTPVYALAPAVVSSKKHLFERVSAILNRNRQVSYRVSRRGYAFALGLMALVVFGAMRFAPVFALQDEDEPALYEPVREERPETVRIDPLEPDIASTPPEAAPSRAIAPPPVVREEPVPISPPEAATPRTSQAASRAPIASLERNEVGKLAGSALPEARASRREAPADDPPLSKRSMIKLLESSQNISSSGDKASLLLKAASRLPDDHDVYTAFLGAASTISSPGDRARVLLALLEHHVLGADSAIVFLGTAAEIPASGDKARVLSGAVSSEALPLAEEAVFDAFIEALESIPSPQDYNRVAELLLNKWDRR